MLRIVNFKLEEEVLEEIDKLTKVNGSRSDIIRAAIELLLYFLESHAIDGIMYEMYHKNRKLYYTIDRLLELKRKLKVKKCYEAKI